MLVSLCVCFATLVGTMTVASLGDGFCNAHWKHDTCSSVLGFAKLAWHMILVSLGVPLLQTSLEI